jgi:thiol-disulfide isomerase/thioredoxin
MTKKIVVYIIVILLLTLKAIADPGYAILSGKSDYFRDADSVTLIINKYGSPDFIGFSRTYGTKIRGHRFRFKVPAGEYPDVFHLYFSKSEDNTNYYRCCNIAYGLIAAGDSIYISGDGNGLRYNGSGSAKMKAFQYFDSLFDQFQKRSCGNSPSGTLPFFKAQDSIFVHGLAYLQVHKHELNNNDFNLLKSFALACFFNKGSCLKMMTDSMRVIAICRLKDYTCGVPDSLVYDGKLNKLAILDYADAYSGALFQKYLYDSCYVIQKRFDAAKYVRHVSENYTGSLRERLLVNFFYTHKKDTINISSLFGPVRQFITNPDFASIVEKLSSSRASGAKAFNFSLTGSDGKVHRMSDYMGKVVFIDFWFTGCGNCAMVAPYLKKIEEAFKDKPVAFLSINLDLSKTTWMKSINSRIYTSAYVTNLFTGGEGFKHPISKYYLVDGGPTLILIGKDGKLLNNPLDPRMDGGTNLRNVINNALNN